MLLTGYALRFVYVFTRSVFPAPWTIAHQAPLSVEFSRQEYWSQVPFTNPGDCPGPGIKFMSPAPPELAGGFFTTSITWEASCIKVCVFDFAFGFLGITLT